MVAHSPLVKLPRDKAGGAILTLSCSFQVDERGPETQSAVMPAVTLPMAEGIVDDAGTERCDVQVARQPPRSLTWVRYPSGLGDDPRLHACAMAYLSDINPMTAVGASHPDGPISETEWRTTYMSASLDHAVWFHRPMRSDAWTLIDMTGHGVIASRGLATGLVFERDGTHVATIAQEGLLRARRQ